VSINKSPVKCSLAMCSPVTRRWKRQWVYRTRTDSTFI